MMRFTAILGGLTAGLTLVSATHADAKINPPNVPAAIQVPAGNEAFMVGYAVGSQNYICLPSGGGYAWSLFTPEALLTRANGHPIATHFFSYNPSEAAGTIRATWMSSHDSSKVWGKAVATSTDAAFVEPGAIPWVLLAAVGTEEGPTGGDRMTVTTYIQRVDTSAGTAPADGCAAAADVGKKAFEPYSATYYFWKAENKHGHDDDGD